MAIGFGIVGCGMIARFHARAIAEVRGARLIGCYNRSPAGAEALAQEFGCQTYGALAGLLADPHIHVICVTTPSGAHADAAIAAARAGKHVVVEKPLEVTLRRCDAIIAACRENRVLLSAIFQSRYQSAAQRLKQAIAAGRFGRLTLADAAVKWFRTQAYYDQGAWRGTWKLDGGGALMNQAIHSVDLLVWLAGDVAELVAHTATLAHERIEVEDCATASLRFRNGALGTIVASTAAYPGSLKRIAIHGSHGSAILEEDRLVQWDFAKSLPVDRTVRAELSQPARSGGGAADPKAIHHAGHAAQIREMVQAIRNGSPLRIDGAEARRSVAVILAAYRSARTGRCVKLE